MNAARMVQITAITGVAPMRTGYYPFNGYDPADPGPVGWLWAYGVGLSLASVMITEQTDATLCVLDHIQGPWGYSGPHDTKASP